MGLACKKPSKEISQIKTCLRLQGAISSDGLGWVPRGPQVGY
jgi:hypothetical protein